LFAFVVFVLVF